MPLSWRFENRAGEETQVGNYTIIPFVKTWQWRTRSGQPGIIWNRPAAILARSADGHEQVLPVHDLTLAIILSLLGVCLGAVMLMWIIPPVRRK